ncbi:MAG: SsrA-binding protein SmpB [Candidatus Eisenbacteria bacterium]|uniref:SsrA-binding protein n=1 Tax=Eiseniibacteriota bacterium TaxID=2212470 RepID=A0A538STM3_UNCEI|nr:MAG: SsrA-binding protein SmpB [Candidatus Eisenbacteria bacterium]TMQ61980.1 MAG: SsrA-binding protein SmpB [Candidatus Eisenbacteria bacterium]
MARPSAPKPHKDDDERQIITTNRKARHDYTIIETFEAGIELRGTEVKSLRDAKAQLVDSYAMVEGGQLYLRNAHIPIYDPASYSNHEPTRTRRLLMHRAEIRRLQTRLDESGLTMVPLSLYFRRGRVKVELAIVKGRRTYDKRAKLDERRSRKEIRGIMRGERPE